MVLPGVKGTIARIGFFRGEARTQLRRHRQRRGDSFRDRLLRLLVIMNLAGLDARWILSPIFSGSVDAMAGVLRLQGCCAGRGRRV